MDSTRFPGKPLCDLCGKPMIQWVVERAIASGVGERVIVATPDHEIIDACKLFGAESMMTRDDHPSGTDRIAEVALSINADVYINVQGDEPLIEPSDIAACTAPLLQDASVEMGSVFAPCPQEEWDNPSVVKVVTDMYGTALYFSRFPIPYPRNRDSRIVKKHIGLYAYTGDVLGRFSQWMQAPLERSECLEQLRFLENGVKIQMSQGQGSAFAVDTPEQADAVRAVLSAQV